MKKLTVLRGLPGCGKSTLAKKLEDEGAVTFSNDAIMTTDDGKYFWTEERAAEAYHENQRRVRQAMIENKPHIVVDNTNIRPYVVAPYVRLAKVYGYEWELIDIDTPWALDTNELAKRNLHNVPLSVIEEMHKAYVAIPHESMVASLTVETAMDPEKSLRMAQEALERSDNFKADEHLIDYMDWRKIGGYEPIAGDETAENMSSKLKGWRADMYAMGF